VTYRYLVESSNQEDSRWDEFPDVSIKYDRFILSQPDDCFASEQSFSYFQVNTATDLVDANPGDGHCSTTSDPFDNSSECTLRAAIMEANAKPGWDAIDLPWGRYALTRTGEEGDGLDDAVGDLDITDHLSITGERCNQSITRYLDPETLEDIDASFSSAIAKITGNGEDRVLQISEAEVHLECLVIAGGRVAGSGKGAGIYNQGRLRTHRVAVTSGLFTDVGFDSHKGAGIYNGRFLSMSESALVGNKGETAGAAFGGTTGGALFNHSSATAHVESTLIAFNSAARGRGIWNEGELTVTSSTFANNTNGSGAGSLAADIFNSGNAEVAFATFNATTWAIRDNGTLSLSNNLFDVSLSPTCVGTVDVAFGNWSSDTTCFGDSGLPNTQDFIPGLGFELMDRGGFTPVMALEEWGPLDTALALDHCPLTDQRGARRPLDPSRCDPGASEYEGYFP
jgi:CSLREA domain-containing protein